MSAYTQRSLAGGEIAPSLFARTDQSKYAISARRLRNMVVMRHGGAQNRAGSRFVAEVKDSTKPVTLIEFNFNSDQTNIIEMGDFYMRFHQNGAQIFEPGLSVTAITKANPAVVTTSTNHGWSNGDEVSFQNSVIGMTELNGRNFIIANKTATTFELKSKGAVNINSTGYGTFVAGPTTVYRVYEIASPYSYAEAKQVDYRQSADVIFMAHKNYAPRKLSRTGIANWTLSTMTFAPSIAAPTGLATTGGAGTTVGWVVTAVAAESYEESLPSTETTSSTSSGTLSWNAVSGAIEYNLYRRDGVNSSFCFIGTSTGLSHEGLSAADPSDNPPTARDPFNGADKYPAVVGLFQQRLCFGRSNSLPQNVWLSRPGSLTNFTIRSPLQDDDSVTFTLLGSQEIRHLIDLGKLIIPTRAGNWTVQGNAAGVITPVDINPIRDGEFGISTLRPVIVGGSLVYVQSQAPTVRDLGFQFDSQGYRGNELSVFAPHLFEASPLVSMAYQRTPHQIVWIARQDGMLLGLTYVREQQIVAWHHHLFSQLIPEFGITPSTAVYPAGLVESVCVVPEGGELGQDFLYVVVQRYSFSESRIIRYIERVSSRYIGSPEKRPLDPDYFTAPGYQFYPRFPDGVRDSIFVDSALSYDGRNFDPAKSVTISGGTDWDDSEDLTVTANSSIFVAGDVGNEVHVLGRFPSGRTEYLRLSITAFTDASTVTVRAKNATVPVALRNAATTQWARAVDTVTGFWHLEGSAISVLGDGFVVANPYRTDLPVVRITAGEAQLDECYAVIHGGLPYVSEVETLDIDTPDGPGLAREKKKVNQVTVCVEDTRGFRVGNRRSSGILVAPAPWNVYEDELEEAIIRSDEPYESPIALQTGWVDVNILPEWNSNGRILIRQIDPLPLSVLAIRPDGQMG